MTKINKSFLSETNTHIFLENNSETVLLEDKGKGCQKNEKKRNVLIENHFDQNGGEYKDIKHKAINL